MEKTFYVSRVEEVIKEVTTLKGADIFKNESLFSKNNKVWLKGKISEDLCFFDLDENGISYFRSLISTYRISGTIDKIPILIPEYLLEIEGKILSYDDNVELCGEFNSRNWMGDDEKIHLDLFITVTAIRKIMPYSTITTNNIYLEGNICKPVIYRETPFGRKIADISLAVNFADKESSFIPCIAWEQDALFAKELKVSQRVKVLGRIQSRYYFKKKDGDIILQNPMKKMVNEISIWYIENIIPKQIV